MSGETKVKLYASASCRVEREQLLLEYRPEAGNEACSDGSGCLRSVGRGLRILQYCPRLEAGRELDLEGCSHLRLGPLLRRVEQRLPKDTPSYYSFPSPVPCLSTPQPPPPHSTHTH